jgi:hypothetical protein
MLRGSRSRGRKSAARNDSAYQIDSVASDMLACSAFAACSVAILALSLSIVFAKDPAEGWLGYATAVSPSGSGRITFAEAYWVVPENPREGGAFYSPWFGIEVGKNQFASLHPLTSDAEQRQPQLDSGQECATAALTNVAI